MFILFDKILYICTILFFALWFEKQTKQIKKNIEKKAKNPKAKKKTNTKPQNNKTNKQKQKKNKTKTKTKR